MRYFLLIFALTVLTVAIIAGRRGELTRHRPIEVFPDMDRQPKLRPQTGDRFFANGLSSQLPVPGTVARGAAYEDSAVNTGKIPGTTNWVESIPVPVTETLLARGQERFNIYCSRCHGETGAGNGIATKFGMAVIANLHDTTGRKIPQQPDGQIFNTITYGKNLMGAYGGLIPVEDRWAIIAYVRALQFSQLATLNDVPAARRTDLLQSQPPAAAPAAAPPATNPPAPAQPK